MLKIGELSTLSNVSRRTIDYYTKLGLIECERSSSNYRLYDKETIEELKFIEHCKRTNMTLEQIKQRKLAIKSNKINTEAIHEQTKEIVNKMGYLKNEIEEIRTIFEKMDQSEQSKMVKNLKPHTVALMQALVLLSS